MTAMGPKFTIADRINELAEEKGYSLHQLSVESGLGKGTISDLMQFVDRKPRPGTLKKIADTLGVDVAYLTGASDTRRAGDSGPALEIKGFSEAGGEVVEYIQQALGVEGPARVYEVGSAGVPFGIADGARVLVAGEADHKSGDLVLTRGQGGALGVGYVAEPYLMSRAADGGITHAVKGDQVEVMGRILASFVLHNR